jgi:hypothetical protein
MIIPTPAEAELLRKSSTAKYLPSIQITKPLSKAMENLSVLSTVQ